MSDKAKESVAGRELSFQRLVACLLRRKWIIVLVSVLCAVVTFLGSYYLITPKDESSTMFYVNNNSLNLSDVTSGLSSGDMTARKNLVDSYIVILRSRTTLNDVIDYAGVDRTVSELDDMIAAAAVNSTEIFEVVVTSEDPYEAERIANAIATILPKRIASIIENTSAKIVDTAVVPSSPSSPNNTLNAIVGFLVGFLVTVCVVILRELFDVVIRAEEDLQELCSYPVLASVPDMQSHSKGGYYYQSASKRQTAGEGADKKAVLIGAGISFSAAEAYKLLRTKLQFSFVDDFDCHIIGVSSALAGEGKSLSSINLAYSLAQLEKRVLLIDCDMRRPSLSAKLPIRKVPGLSNYLTRQSGKDEVIQKYTEEESGFDVISAGRNPPNPIELLSSDRMKKVLDELRADYDYILLDLPPVGEVSDALVAAKLVDGMLMVVRQNYCDRVALSSAVEQFKFVGSQILGVVFNCTTEERGHYGKRYYKGGKYYYSRYEGSYVAAAKAAQKDAKRKEQ